MSEPRASAGTPIISQSVEGSELDKTILACEFLMKRQSLMRELAEALERASCAVADSNFIGLVQQTSRQQEIVQSIRQLDASARQVISLASTQNSESEEAGQRFRQLLTDLNQAQALATTRNRLHGALLRRSRRTTDIFARLLANAAHGDGTYSAACSQCRS